jgi:ribosomal protein S18 acetylase RimI-like enzyme
LARLRSSAVIEPLGSDLVALAQACALDVTTFPHASIPPVFGDDAPPAVWIARADRDGPVVGFIATRATQTALDVSGLAVDVAHRRAGLGRALLRAVVRSARKRGFETVELTVSTSNVGAIDLYAREGFREARRIAGFYSPEVYGDAGDALLMVRDVS